MTVAPPRERDAVRSRSAILDAAERLFAERGYEGTALADVGHDAGLSRGAPAYFFGTKQALYLAVLERCSADAREAVRRGLARARASGEPPRTILAGVVAEYFDFLAAHPTVVRLLEWEALAGPGRLDATPFHADALTEALAALVDELGVAPARTGEVAQLLCSIVALCWFPIVHARTMLPRLGLDLADPAVREARRRHVVELVLRGAGSLAPTP